MNAILLSIQPKWCELIASGEKTYEVRKTKPKIDIPFKCYIYMTKTCYISKSKQNDRLIPIQSMGKVIGEFVCDEINMDIVGYKDSIAGYYNLYNDSCLSNKELISYGNFGRLYGWHISDLIIYEQPKALSDFKQCHKCEYHLGCKDGEYSCDGTYRLNKPPQSWCYVEEVS